jgi:hypothetical protein
MVNERIRTLHEVDGTPVCNVSFDLSPAQLGALAHASAEMLVERHRGQALETDDVLALRELTAVRDEVDRLAEPGGNATLVLPLGRFIVLHDASDEYVGTRSARDWLREADAAALPLLGAMLAPMDDLRARAVAATLAAAAPH